MGKNQFSTLATKVLPKEEELAKLVGNLEYKRISTDELPEAIKENDLIKKFNSGLLAASGSTQGTAYSFVGFRPDNNNTVIDEHPFVFYYDKNGDAFGGIIHHGDWPGRTTPLSDQQMAALAASGITANFTYKGIPPASSGSLYDLEEKGMLEGISEQYRILLQKGKK